MSFLNKLKDTMTGKTEIERLQEKAALKEIKKDVNSARLRTQRDEAVKFAIELEKHKYKKRLEQAKAPKPSFGSGMGGFNLGGFGTPLGQPRQMQPAQPQTRRVRVRVQPKRRRVKYVGLTQNLHSL